MPPLNAFVTFGVMSALLIVVPGPSVLFTVSRALTVGRRAALLTVLGNAAGCYVQVVAVAFGVGALLARSVEAFTVIKLVGAGYLIYLGVQAIRHRRDLGAALGGQATPKTARRVLADGFVVGMANPKTIVFFPLILPQFLAASAPNLPAQILLLGALFPLIALVSDSAWAVLAGAARAWLARSPRRIAMVGGASGLVMIGLGARLAFTHRSD